jgi:hypothetical protein
LASGAARIVADLYGAVGPMAVLPCRTELVIMSRRSGVQVVLAS